MKNICFFLILILSLFANTFAQKAKPTPKPTAKTNVSPTEISEADWKNLVNVVAKEDWKTAENLSLDYLKKLPKENLKRQIAQLNYIYIFALEGEVSKGDLEFDDFEEILKNFIGKEFLMPSRQILANCKKVLNYICPSENESGSLFISATNSSATVIHSFEYYQLNEPLDINKYKTRMAFLSGKLNKFSLNPQKTNTWIARLYFNNTKVEVLK
jgi:hypothetical protein